MSTLDSIGGRVPPRAALDWRFGIGLAAAFALALLPRIYVHEMWRDEWHTWLLCRDTGDFATLFARVRYDGHPITWYAIVWLAGRAWDDPTAMKLAHAAIATLTALLIGVAAPFARWQRALLAFGYFFAFEYAVISRNYALGALALLLAAACQHRAPARPIATCAALALAVHANAFAALVALMLAAHLAIRWWSDPRVVRRSIAVGLAIVAASCVLVAYETRPPADLANTPWRFDASVRRVGQLAAAGWRTFAPIPMWRRSWWGTNVLDPSLASPATRTLEPILGLLILAAATYGVARDWKLRALFAAIVVAVLGFAYVKITGTLRHHGVLFVAFVAIRWIGVDGRAANVGAERFWRSILAAQAVAGVAASIADVALPFTAARATAAWIAVHAPDAQVIAQRDFEGCSIAGYLGRPVYFPTPGRWGTYIVYDRLRGERASAARLTEAAAALHADDPARPVLLVLSDESLDRVDDPRFHRVARFIDSSLFSERFTVYRWTPDEAR